jgi:hypothetical protein
MSKTGPFLSLSVASWEMLPAHAAGKDVGVCSDESNLRSIVIYHGIGVVSDAARVGARAVRVHCIAI